MINIRCLLIFGATGLPNLITIMIIRIPVRENAQKIRSFCIIYFHFYCIIHSL